MRLPKYITTVVLVSLALAAITTIIVNLGLQRSSIDFYGKINTVNNPSEDINILLAGSSRTLTNVNPRIIDSVTHLTSYNAGLNAATIKTCYNIISLAIQNQPHLKTIVLNVDYNMFQPERDPYKDPYYYAYTYANNNIILTDSNTANKLHKLKIFDITAYDDYVIYASLRGLISSKSSNDNKGFMPHTQTGFVVPDTSLIPKGYELPSKKGEIIFRKIIALCKAKKIILILVIAPFVKRYAPVLYISNYNTIINRIKEIALQNQVTFTDYSSTKIADDTSCFFNSWHLNLKGSGLYSLQVANSLKHLE